MAGPSSFPKKDRARAAVTARRLALATVLDDLAESGDISRETPALFSAPLPNQVQLDRLVLDVAHHASLSDSVCVCALVYLGRIKAGASPNVALKQGTLHRMLIGAFAIAAEYVDKPNKKEHVRKIAQAVSIQEKEVEKLRDKLIELLQGQTYISLATFREYDTIIESIISDK